MRASELKRNLFRKIGTIARIEEADPLWKALDKVSTFSDYSEERIQRRSENLKEVFLAKLGHRRQVEWGSSYKRGSREI